MSEQQLIIFNADNGQVEVRLEGDTIWLSQAQMAELFGKDVRTVNEHISNIYEEAELEQAATIRDFRLVRQEGKRQVQREITHYNLDMIISVGYRVNSSRATRFRQWATKVLKQHLIDGYTLNQQRLQERGIEFEQAVSLLSRTLSNQALVNTEGAAVLGVITEYARSWSLLQQYDEQSLSNQTCSQLDMRSLELPDVLTAIGQLKAKLMEKGEATALFGQLRGDGLASSIATIEQGFGDELFYPNVASRTLH